jgi:hypothetical protein
MTQTIQIQIPPPELVDTSKLSVHKTHKNPNSMSREQLDRLKSSIQKYGFLVPIITNKDLVIADGEQRWIIANELAMPQVLVVRVPLEEVDRLLIQQIMNSAAVRGIHDLLLDAQSFENIIDLGRKDDLKYLLDLTDKDLAKYLGELNPAKEDDFQIPEVEKVSTDILRGNIFQLGNHRLMCGDSKDNGQITELMENGHPDVLLTDPPYGIQAVEKSNCLSSKYSPIINDSEKFNPTNLLSLAPTIILFGANYYADKLPISSCWIIWSKHATGKESTDQADCELAWTNQNKPARIYSCVWTGYWREGESNKNPRTHPAQKPIKLMADIISNHSESKQKILDLFGGSGSTLIACEQTGRTCYMMEIDPRYCEIICQRWERYTGQKRVKLVNSGKSNV